MKMKLYQALNLSGKVTQDSMKLVDRITSGTEKINELTKERRVYFNNNYDGENYGQVRNNDMEMYKNILFLTGDKDKAMEMVNDARGKLVIDDDIDLTGYQGAFDEKTQESLKQIIPYLNEQGGAYDKLTYDPESKQIFVGIEGFKMQGSLGTVPQAVEFINRANLPSDHGVKTTAGMVIDRFLNWVNSGTQNINDTLAQGAKGYVETVQGAYGATGEVAESINTPSKPLVDVTEEVKKWLSSGEIVKPPKDLTTVANGIPVDKVISKASELWDKLITGSLDTEKDFEELQAFTDEIDIYNDNRGSTNDELDLAIDDVVARKRAQEGVNETSKVDWDFISKREGGLKTTGYVPKGSDGKAAGHSGVTIGVGVDIGQWDKKTLENIGVPCGS
jgi:hypothetical protein